MRQTANSQNVQFDTNYKHNIQRIFWNFSTHDPTQTTEIFKNLPRNLT